MKEIVEAVNTRFKAPYFGYSVLAFFALNWRGIFLLTISDGTPEGRIALFDGVTSTYTLVVFPLLVGAFIAASADWIRYIFGLISRKPLELIQNQSLEAEHKKTIRQAELERSRSQLFGAKEDELIERAKRDEQVASIEDQDTKERLIAQLEGLRSERDRLSEQLKSQDSSDNETDLSSESLELLRAAAKDKSGVILKSRTIGGASVQAGGSSFGAGSPREFAKYQKALDDLIAVGYVAAMGQKGEVFQLTHDGWQVADTL